MWGVRGKVSQVKLSAEFLASNTQLTNMCVLVVVTVVVGRILELVVTGGFSSCFW